MAHGAVKYLLRVLEAILLVVVLGAGVLAWRLSQGPVTISIVAPYVASVLEDLNPGYQFHIEQAEFQWLGFEGQPKLTVRNIRVQDDSGSVIAGLPSLSAELSVPALIRGDVAPERITLSDPILRFVHRVDGTFGLGVEGSAARDSTETVSGTVLLATLIQSLTEPGSDQNRTGYLQSVAIDGTTLMLVDEATGRRWLAPNAVLGFERNNGGMEFHATLPVTEDGKTWDATAKGKYDVASNSLVVDFNVEGFRPARIADLAPQLSALGMIDLGLSGIVSAKLALMSQGAQIESIKFDVTGQSGRIRMEGETSFDYPIRSVTLKGSAGRLLDRITIDQFQAVLDRTDEQSSIIEVSASGSNLNTAPVIDLNATLDEISIAALKEYWPQGVKPNTHSWIEKNLSNGGLSNTEVVLKASGPSFEEIDAANLRLTSQLHGITVQYIQGMPKVQEAGGIMTLGLDEILIEIDEGYVPDAIAARDLRVERGLLRMHNLGERGTELADFDIDIVGDFGAVMRLIDNEPLGYATAVGMDANATRGQADIELALDFPLVKDLKLDQVDILVKANVIGAEVPDVAFGLPLERGRMNVVLDKAGMDVQGDASLGGIPASVKWRENFAGGEFKSRYELHPVVDNDLRPKIGLGMVPFTPPYIDGAVPADVVYTVGRSGEGSLSADIDLTDSVVAVPELGWRKETGIEAKAHVSAAFEDGQLVSIPQFTVHSGDELSVSGEAVFGEDTKLRSLIFNPSIVGETELAGAVRMTDNGRLSIDVTGPAFNATSFFKTFAETDPENNEEARTPVKVTARVDRMWLASDAEFTDADLVYEADENGVQRIDFTSTVDGSIPVEFKLSSGSEGRTFRGISPDGGSVLRAVGLFNDFEGGQLEITGDLTEDGTVRGVALMEDFNLVDAPVIARLLSVASLTGILDELRGEGISFDILRVPFSYANSSLNINDGEMFGSSLGLTGEGDYNFASSTMNFDGTLIPAYTFNSALNSIPLIGDLFTAGDKGSGIFAATYSYRGDVATAQPTVNPLAALAPGFLRHIFDIFKSRPQEAYVEPSKPKKGGKDNDSGK